MPVKSKVPALEVTTFKLRQGLKLKDFISANADVDPWLIRQPGFRTRYISQRDDGTVVDVIYWDSVAEGTRSMHRLLDELADSPVHDCIDQRTVKWSIAPIGHSISAKGA